MTSLYIISEDFRFLLQQYDEALSEEERVEIERQLNLIQGEKENKFDNSCAYIKNLDGFITMLESEIAQLTAKKKSLENKQAGFKRYLASCCLKGEKWTNGLHSIGWRKSEAVEIPDEEKVPIQFKQIKTEIVCNKKAIKEHIEENPNEPIDWAFIKKSNNIQIK